MVQPRSRVGVRPGSHRRGFTIVELLVVVAIIGVLVAIMLPSLGSARAMATRTACQANLRSVGQAFASYTIQYNGLIPTGCRQSGSGENYRIYTSSKYYAQGWLYNGQYLSTYKAFFCPTQKNSWYTLAAPGNTPFLPGNTPTGNFWTGQSVYYAPDWPGTVPGPSSAQGGNLIYKRHYSSTMYKLDDFLPACNMANNPVAPIGAFYTDALKDYSFIDMAHGTGANFLYADFSVGWLGRKTIGPQGYSLDYYTTPTNFPNNLTPCAAAQQAIYDLAGQMK